MRNWKVVCMCPVDPPEPDVKPKPKPSPPEGGNEDNG